MAHELEQAGNIYLSHSKQHHSVNVSLSLSFSLWHKEKAELGEKLLMIPVTIMLMKIIIIIMTFRIIVLILFVFKTPFYFVCLLHVTLVPTPSCNWKCVCAFFYFWDKKEETKIYIRFAIMPHSQGYSILTLFSCCLLLLNLILHSSRVKKYTISRKCRWKYLLFLLVPFCVCRLRHQPAFVSLCLHSSFSLELACFFMHHITHPVISTTLFFAHVFVYMHLPPCLIMMFSVLFSVSKLFVPFSVSFLSLLGPCVEGGQCFLSTLCG